MTRVRTLTVTRARYDEAIRCYSAAIALDDAAQGAEKASAAPRATLLSNP